MSGKPPPVFLQRQSYRRRRAKESARLLPVLGILLLAVPMLWPTVEGAQGEAVPISRAMIYVFLVWAGLIVLAALFSVFVARNPEDDPEEAVE